MNELLDIRKYNVLVFDIETANEFESFSKFKDENLALAEEYIKKFETDIEEIEDPKMGNSIEKTDYHYKKNAALYPEYGRVLCCSFTTVKYDSMTEKYETVTKSFKSLNEKELLDQINRVFEKEGWIYSGMNLNAFDIPFLLKRMMINEVSPSKRLTDQVFSKPWERKIIDIADIWAFGGFGRGSRSVKLGAMCACLGVETPKEGIWGPLVPSFFWTGKCEEIYGDEIYNQTKALKIIDDYCQKDTEATANVLIKLNSLLF